MGLFIVEQLDEETLGLIAMRLGAFGKSKHRENEHKREREIRLNWELARTREKWRSKYL